MKILIVDDEIIIREGLRNVINWEENGFQLLEPVSSAEEAMETVHKAEPDIILTDIQMNGKSGLDLASYIFEHELPIEVIILSGHDEFSYAQEALRQGVSDYLLKISSPNEILKAVHKAREKLENVKKHAAWKQEEQGRMLSSLIRKCIHHLAEPADIEQLHTLFPELQGSPIQIGLLDVPLDTSQLAKYEQLWNTYICGKWLLLHDKTVIIIKRKPRLEDEYVLQMAARKIGQSLNEPLYLGNVVSALKELYASYETAESLFLYKWLFPNIGIISEKDIQHRTGISHTEKMRENEEKMLKAMNTGHSKEVEDWLMRLIDSLFSHAEATPGSIQLYMDTLFVTMIRFVNTVAASHGKKTLNYRSIPSPAEWFPAPRRRLLPSFIEVFEDYQYLVMKEYNFVQLAVHYIQNKLEQPITLQEVADHVYVHPNYLSEMLRKETGKSYVEFITDLRMKKAKELLLHSSVKVKEISISVGYTDWKYFTSQFKKYTGMTPSQYRKSLLYQG